VNTRTAKSNSKEKAETKDDKPAQLSLSPEELLTLPTQNVVNHPNSSLDGLTSQEVEKRLKIYGRNELFHHRIFIRGLIDKEKEEIMGLGIVAVDIMHKTVASIKQTVLVP